VSPRRKRELSRKQKIYTLRDIKRLLGRDLKKGEEEGTRRRDDVGGKRGRGEGEKGEELKSREDKSAPKKKSCKLETNLEKQQQLRDRWGPEASWDMEKGEELDNQGLISLLIRKFPEKNVNNR